MTAARRELIEETGYDARRFTLLAHAPTSPGLTTEVVTFFRAAGLKKVGAGGGIEGEDIVIHTVKLCGPTRGSGVRHARENTSIARYSRGCISRGQPEAGEPSGSQATS